MNTKTKQGGLGIVSIPVSYTHLDVYKRQGRDRQRLDRRLGAGAGRAVLQLSLIHI